MDRHDETTESQKREYLDRLEASESSKNDTVRETRNRFVLALVLGGGFVGAGLGVCAALTAEIPGWFLVPIGGAIGFIPGCICGGILSLFVPRLFIRVRRRTWSAGPQLVGQYCILCHKEITSILEGEFCRQCRAPIHLKCIPETIDQPDDRCPRCGSYPAGE